MTSRARIAVALCLSAVLLTAGLARVQAQAPPPAEFTIGYLHRPPAKSAISLLEVPAPDDGVAGAELAVEDNNTTGQFLGQHFALAPVELKNGEDPAAAVASLGQRGVS
ncbi:MAG: branched-chain amino acid ABC transporter substrate-binding protein, partial [Hyphomicrobiales bacterium]|nr:branched-chain amino acid ABC transporter substrate-binding protein [Hyphomicrobiales bacterium]